MRLRFLIICLILFGLLAAACSSLPNQTTEPQASEPPAGKETVVTDPLVPSPESGKAVLSGTLIQRSYDEDPDAPYAGLRIYLGVILPDDQGNMSVGRVDRNNAPTTRTDASGRFVFSNLEPGAYILAALIPPNNIIMLRDPDTGTDMLIELSEGQLLDMGEMLYDFPFLDNS